jgi:hypothetical protein
MNLYAYVGGSPVMRTDPSGLIAPAIVGAAYFGRLVAPYAVSLYESAIAAGTVARTAIMNSSVTTAALVGAANPQYIEYGLDTAEFVAGWITNSTSPPGPTPLSYFYGAMAAVPGATESVNQLISQGSSGSSQPPFITTSGRNPNLAPSFNVKP